MTRYAAIIFALILATPALGGELQCRGACNVGPSSGISWEPSDCEKPVPPAMLATSDAGSLNARILAFNAYSARIQPYLDCLAGEAQGDMQELLDVVSQGHETHQTEILEEMRATRTRVYGDQ